MTTTTTKYATFENTDRIDPYETLAVYETTDQTGPTPINGYIVSIDNAAAFFCTEARPTHDGYHFGGIIPA